MGSILLSLASAVIGGLIVAFANHWMTKRRDIETKRREIALTRLVEAWFALDYASDRPGVRQGDLTKLEEAVRTIVLFGEDKEVDMAEKAMNTMVKAGYADFTDLLVELRQRIRTSTGIAGKRRHFWYAIKVPKDDGQVP
jgi:hypothetical protein